MTLSDMSVWELTSILSKALIYTSMLAIMGGMLVLWMNRQFVLAAQTITRSYLLPAALTGLLATCLFFLIQIGSVNQSGIAGMFDPLIGSILVDTEVGAALRWRLAGFLLALLALMPLNLPGYPFQYQAARRFTLITTLASAACFAVAVASQGHASAVSVLAEVLAALHLLAVGCWAGALYPLYLLVSHSAHTEASAHTVATAPANVLPQTPAPLDIAATLERFGVFAWLMLGLMLLTGISLIQMLTGGVLTLPDNLHGQLLLLKMLLVAGMMALGALHKFSWVPQLRALARAETAVSPSLSVRLKLARSIRLEMLLALLVLLLTASLTTITGPSA